MFSSLFVALLASAAVAAAATANITGKVLPPLAGGHFNLDVL
jgi:hypothetical protein